MKNLGERIQQSIARIETMQKELDERLNKLEEEEVVQIDDCIHRDNTHCTLRNKQCYGVEHCSNYQPIILKGEKQMEATYRFTEEGVNEENKDVVLKVYCKGPKSIDCTEMWHCCWCEHQDTLEFVEVKNVCVKDFIEYACKCKHLHYYSEEDYTGCTCKYMDNDICTGIGYCEYFEVEDNAHPDIPFYDDPFTDNEDYGIFDEYDYDPAYSPMIDRDIPF